MIRHNATKLLNRTSKYNILSPSFTFNFSTSPEQKINNLMERLPFQKDNIEKHITQIENDDMNRGKIEFALPPPLTMEECKRINNVKYNTWGDYFIGRKWDEKCINSRLTLQTLSGALSTTLTLYDTICFSEKKEMNYNNRLPSSSSEYYEIHIIGAANENEGALLNSGWVFEELTNLIDVGKPIHISFIGPEIATTNEYIELVENKLFISCYTSEYVSFIQMKKIVKPSVAMCFNSGVGTDSLLWEETIQLLLNDEDITLRLTSFDELDSEMDCKALDSFHTSNTSSTNINLRQTYINPFGSTMGEIRTGKQGEAFAIPRVGYSNCYMHSY
jgi:hypothetical protein